MTVQSFTLRAQPTLTRMATPGQTRLRPKEFKPADSDFAGDSEQSLVGCAAGLATLSKLGPRWLRARELNLCANSSSVNKGTRSWMWKGRV